MRKPALFLDRDGVIIFDSGYVREADKVALIPGVARLISRALTAGMKVIVVTNQSGLGRGWITLENYTAVSERMIELLGQAGSRLDHIYFCPFFEPQNPGPEHLRSPSFESKKVPQTGRWDLKWRKPEAGMIETAVRDHGIDLSASIMIGDRATDVVTGCLAGIPKTYMLTSTRKDSQEEINELAVWRSRIPTMSNGTKQDSDLKALQIQSLDEVPIP